MKYVVSYANLFDNELEQEIIEADTPLDAALRYLVVSQEMEFPEQEYLILSRGTLADLQEQCYNSDQLIAVIEIGV